MDLQHQVLSGAMPEVLECVLVNLPACDLCRLSTVCKDWHAIAEKDYIWEKICQNAEMDEEDEPVVVTDDDNQVSYHKLLYKRYTLSRQKWLTGKEMSKYCRQLKTLDGQKIRGRCLALSSRHIFVIMADDDRVVYVFSTKYGHLSHVLIGQSYTLDKLLLTNEDAMAVAWPSCAQVVTVWNTASGTCVQSLVHPGNVSHMHLHDMILAVAVCNYSSVFVWNIESGEKLHELLGHDECIYHLHVGDRRMVSCDDNSYGEDQDGDNGVNTIKLWDIKTGACLYTWIEPHFGDGTSLLMIDDDTNSVVHIGRATGLIVWDTESGTAKQTRRDIDSQSDASYLNKCAKLYIFHERDSVCQLLTVVDLKSGVLLNTIEGGSPCGSSPMNHPSGCNGLLVSKGYSRHGTTIDLWDIENMVHVKQIHKTQPALFVSHYKASTNHLMYVVYNLHNNLLKFVKFKFIT